MKNLNNIPTQHRIRDHPISCVFLLGVFQHMSALDHLSNNNT